MPGLNQTKNPFPGLRPFKPGESHLFFGRDGQIDELLDRLDRNRFLAVVGTSGSGKSSLVSAGLLPIVHGGFMKNAGSHWRIAMLRPGDDPIGNLAEALSQPGVLNITSSLEEDPNLSLQTAVTEAALRRGSLGLVEIVRQSRLSKKENLLLVVDQFKELFRFKESDLMGNAPDEAAAFVKLLLKSIEQKEVPIYVVITMRSEFLGDCAQFRDLPEAINNSQYLIPRMTREEKREAIVGPTAVRGAEITPALVSRLLNDVGDSPDQLPILQHALMRTWDYWDKNHKKDEPLDLGHYESIGAMEQALSQHAEEAYKELKTKKKQTICEKMFKLLVQIGEKGLGMRRLASVSEICSVANASEKEVIDVINVFHQPGRTFLMSSTEGPLNAYSAVDISHESLMRIWWRLIEWVKEEEQSAELYLRLAKDAALHEKGEVSLWRDPELGLALKWWDKSDSNKAWADRYDSSYYRAIRFLVASKKQKQHEIMEKEREQRAELKRTRIFAIIVSIAAVISIVLAVVAWEKKQEADETRKIAVKEKIEADEQRKIAEAKTIEADYLREIAVIAQGALKKEIDSALEKTKRAIKAEKAAVESANKEKKAKIEAESEKRKAEEKELNARIKGLIVDLDKEKEKFRQYLGKAKKLAIQSIAQTGDKELKALLALTAYQLNLKAYTHLAQSTQKIFKKFDESILNKFDRIKELVDLYTEFKEKYEGFQKESKKKNEPAEIFEALRKAYINNNEDSKDILAPAESWVLAVTRDNKIVFNNQEGELLLRSIQDNSDDSKLPVLKKDNIDSLEYSEFYVNSFAETKDRLFCGTRDTREDSIIYWEKNNWEKKIPLARHNARILSMAVSENRGLLFYSVKNEIYTHNIKSNSNDTEKAIKFEEDNFIRALTVIENVDNSFLIAADEKGEIPLLKLDLSGDIVNLEKEKRLFKGTNKSAFHSIAYHPQKKLLVLGNSSGEILPFPNIDCNYLKSNPEIKIQSYYMHNGIVKALAFSPDGRYLASGGLDGTIRLWNVEGKKAEEIEWQAPILKIDSKLKILSIVFDSKGEYMIFSDEHNLRICPTNPQTFHEKLCKRKWRKLTKEEWNQYVGGSINQKDFIICSSKKGE